MAAEANGAFHLALAQASRNAIIANLVRHCLDQVTRIIALGVDYAPLQKSASGEHDAVVDAIERRDPDDWPVIACALTCAPERRITR